MKLTRFLPYLVGIAAVASIGLASADTTTRPAAAPLSESTATPMDAAQLRSEGIEKAMAGRFQAGLDLVGQAAKLAPEDSTSLSAKNLLDQYLKYRLTYEATRRQEYQQAVQRVGQCLQAEKIAPELAASGIMDAIRDKVKQTFDAYGKAIDAVESSQSAQTQAAELRRQAGLPDSDAQRTTAKATELDKQAGDAKADSLAAMDRTETGLKEISTCLDKAPDDYAKVCRRLLDHASKQLAVYRKAWTDAKTGSPEDLERRNIDLKMVEDKLAEALADVDTLIDKEPWRIGITQAHLAKLLAQPGDKPTEQGWYRELTQSIMDRGAKALADARWYDALSAYLGLEDLEEDNLTYQQKVKEARRHVRVLNLYGGKTAAMEIAVRNSVSTSQPATEPAEDDQATWQDMVSGVDAEMVKNAIAQIDLHYWRTVDYRKLGQAALSAIRVLAETPQASKSFKNLDDAKKKQDFIKAIDAQTKALEQRDRVDHLDLLLSLNAVLRASEDTVEIPGEVISVEFTDGLFGELDRFSTMIWPHDVTDFNKNTMGHFCGIGVQITKDVDKPLKVVTPMAKSPAIQAGVRAGDLILAVDGTRTEGLSIDKLIDMIMGIEGTKVVLTIDRPGRLAPFDVEVVRTEITIQTVKGWKRQPGGTWQYLLDPEGGVGYIRLTQFTEKTRDELIQAISDLQKELTAAGGGTLRSLVLDLRYNPGGLLRSAADVADEFLRDGTIVSTRGRQKDQNEFSAHPTGAYLTNDLVVLVNDQSASAAEILSGALKDLHRAVIVGERSFGKGSVQNVIPIRQRRALLKLTTAHYYLPSGRLLDRQPDSLDWGVDPDVPVLATPQQAKRLNDIRRRTELLTDESPRYLDEDLKTQLNEDVQLRTAVLMLRLMQLQKKAAPSAPVVAGAPAEINAR